MDNSIYEKYMSAHLYHIQGEDPSSTVEYYRLSLGEVLPVNQKARIFDIGFGMGKFLYFLKTLGYENISGLEICREEYEYVRNNICEEVALTEDTLAWLNESKDNWDCISMLDVIEHLPKPKVIPILSAIRERLISGGYLIIKTDNMSGFTGLFQRYMDFTHESGFVEHSLREVLRMAGFIQITIFGEKYERPKFYHPKAVLLFLLRKVWFRVLPLIYSLERGGNNPRIFAKNLIAVART
jgi:2-polyprenyl-3-methyl-5-hydroxy-6-metoxy-1,4-benzoquinol methylase